MLIYSKGMYVCIIVYIGIEVVQKYGSCAFCTYLPKFVLFLLYKATN